MKSSTENIMWFNVYSWIGPKMFWICRNRKVVTLKTQKTYFKPWHKTTLRLLKRRQQAHQEKVGPHLPRPNGAPRQRGQRGEGCRLHERACQPRQSSSFLSVRSAEITFCSLWLSHLSLVDQWSLQWTRFLVLHLVKCFFLYFCWRLNICINCKYIWFITVRVLVPISGFSFSSIIVFNHCGLRLSSNCREVFKMCFSLYKYIWSQTPGALGPNSLFLS